MEGEVIRRTSFGERPLVGERGTLTQRRILGAGLDVFAEHGYHDARVELITEVAGCSRPAFYQYFSSKEDLFWHLAGHLARALHATAERIEPAPADDTGVDSTRAWLGELVDLSVDFAPIMTGFQAAVRDRVPDGPEFRRIGARVGEAVIASGGEGPEPAVTALTNTTTGVVLRSIFYWHVGVGGLSRPRLETGLARMVHRLLHGPVPGVNVDPVTKAPRRRPPKWPEFPETATAHLPTRERGRRTRRSLLDAARVVLPRRGYHDTRVDDVVAEAGVSHGTFYRYFGHKDDLFHVLAQETVSELVELVASFPDTVTDGSVHAWLRDWFAAYRDNGGVISAWQEFDHEDPELARYSLAVAAVLFDRLTRIVHTRDFGDPTVDALVLLSVIERVPYSVLVLGHLDEDEAVAAATLVIRRGIFGLDA
ncbi:MAG: TetR/AcrR family transcriptional regulator [Acidimicrobiales bacterium]|nr:TetR/AcrR family transcriptional regulator [Acidimicrobiales bacterium]